MQLLKRFAGWRKRRRERAIERLTDGRRQARQPSPADGNYEVYQHTHGSYGGGG